jgi:hypothetical protein
MLTTPLYLISDDQATTTGLVALKKNVDIQGPGQIKLTNGSTAVTGFSTTFTDASNVGVSFWFSFWVKDSANNWYHCFVSSITNNTSLTISSASGTYGRSLIRGGYIGVNGDGVGNTYTGVTGTYDYWILRNWSDGSLSNSDGNNSYADNFGTAIGGHSTVIGQTGFASGFYSYVSGIQGIAMGRYVRSTGNEAFAGGKGVGTNKSVFAAGQTAFNFSEVNSSQIAGHGALAANSAILGGVNQNIPSNSTRSVIIGGNTIKATSATTDTVFMPRVRLGYGTAGTLVTGTSTNLLSRNQVTGEIEVTSLAATNGLSLAGGGTKVKLGGALTGSTIVSLPNLTGATFTTQLSTYSRGHIEIGISVTASTKSYVELHAGSSSQISVFCIDPYNIRGYGHGNWFVDNLSIGLQYKLDYSANYTPRSLVDKAYVTGTTYLNTGVVTDIKIGTVGKGLYIKEGANATMGVKTLTGGTAVVATTKVTASSRIFLDNQSLGGTAGFLLISARSAGTSFTITSSSGTDTSVIAWLIIEPA